MTPPKEEQERRDKRHGWMLVAAILTAPIWGSALVIGLGCLLLYWLSMA